MGLARTHAVALVGLVGHVVEIEADVAQGIPGLTLVGLPDAALTESRDRVRAAVVNSGLPWPQRRITVNLSPASLPKRGAAFDLGLAVAVLAAADELPAGRTGALLLLGELGLDGRLRPVPGVLPAVLAGVRAGLTEVVVPAENLAEAGLVPGATVQGAKCLADVVRLLKGLPVAALPPAPSLPTPRPPGGRAPDLADVRGQADARHALEVAAAGGHHLLLTGPPGVGKTMLAERLPGLLPPLTPDQALEVTAVHSVAGRLPMLDRPLVTLPPFQAPHHTASTVSLIGGGSAHLHPGAASLATHGVLFLDEAPEFATGALDALREPLESGTVTIRRRDQAACWPARFQLVLAANPCPCGRAHTPGADCTCSSQVRRRYLARLSGPLMDRVDLRCRLLAPSRADLLHDAGAESTAVVAARVLAARERARRRLADSDWATMAQVPGHELQGRIWRTEPGALTDALGLVDRGRLSARGLHRVTRVAWTLADLAGADRPDRAHVATALGLRGEG